MAVFTLPLRTDCEALKIEDLPTCRIRTGTKIDLQIARHLAKVLKEHGHPAILYLPPALTLAVFYHCPIIDVLKGLQELKKQGHDYKLHALDTAVSLYDASNKHLPIVYRKTSH